MLDPIRKTIIVPCNQHKAFDIFLQDMPDWWPLDKRSMSLMNSKKLPKELSVDAREGGEIVETAWDNSEYVWGTITQYDPYDYLAMDFHMGMPKENASLLEIAFEELDDGRTRVELTQSNWEAFGDLAEMMRGGYGSSWDLLFEDAYFRACGGEPDAAGAAEEQGG